MAWNDLCVSDKRPLVINEERERKLCVVLLWNPLQEEVWMAFLEFKACNFNTKAGVYRLFPALSQQ